MSDSAAVTAVIHGFYKWYDGFIRDEARDVNFTNDEGEHLRLNMAALETYYDHFRKSGFVSEEFIQNEYVFYRRCEALWQNEAKDEVPSCMDADKYFCAQDWDVNFWTTSPVRIVANVDDTIIAKLSGEEAGAPSEQNFQLKKENGKWLITRIECDMGIE